MVSRISLLLTMSLVLLTGCSREAPDHDPPEATTASQWRDRAIAARTAARLAMSRGNAKAARGAADEAGDAVDKLQSMLGDPPTHAERLLLDQASAAAREAREDAETAAEKDRLAAMKRSLTARAYGAARKVALVAVFRSMAVAAEQAARLGLDKLPPPVQDTAQDAADLVMRVTGPKFLPDATPDWAGIASDLNGYTSQPPVQLSLFAAVALLLSGQDSFALYEVERINPGQLKTDHEQAGFLVLRGILYRLQGLDRLATADFEILVGDDEDGLADSLGPELEAGVHLLLAAFYADGGKYRQADQAIAHAIRLWPNNPASVFLTGERLAASGERIKAAESLEAWAADTQHEWLARHVAQRARELRDGTGEVKPLIHDPAFLRRLILHYLGQSARQSEIAAKLQGAVDSARRFGANMLRHLPIAGADDRNVER